MRFFRILLVVILVLGLGMFPFAQAQTLSIEKTWGGNEYDDSYSVVVDAAGNIYVTGDTDSFGAGGDDVVVLKYNSGGVLQWQTTWGGTGDDESNGIAMDTSGNIYVTGYTGDVDLDLDADFKVTGSKDLFGAGFDDVFLLKYNSGGVLQWQTTWGGTGYDIGYGVAVDYLGDIYVTGLTTSFGAGISDVVVLKYNSGGVLQWQTTWGGLGEDEGYGIAVGAPGSIYITGYTDSFAGFADVLMLEYTWTGMLLYATTWGGSLVDIGFSIAVDSLANVYITGGTGSFGAGIADVFLLKYDSANVLQWQKVWGGIFEDVGYSVAVDASGRIYVTGYAYSFGSGLKDAFLLKYNPAGVILWQKTYGGAFFDVGYAVTVDASSKIYVTGLTYNSVRVLQSVSGTETAVAGTVTLPVGTETTPAGIVTTPAGLITTPTGSETYAGAGDGFLLIFNQPLPVGGEFTQANTFNLLSPYIILAALGAATVAMLLLYKKQPT